jgi:hypothetical protein
MKTCVVLFAALLLGSLLSGCASSSARTTPDVQVDNTRPELTVGMAATDVERLWGRPSKVRPVADPAMTVEVWTYFGTVSTRAVPVITSVQRVPAFNLAAENMITQAPEPVYQVETRRYEEVITVVLINGRVVDLRRATRELPSMVQ